MRSGRQHDGHIARCGLVLGAALALGVAPVRSQTPPPAQSTAALIATRLPPYRNRLLGVFNAETGEPIEGALIMDALTRASSVTTSTGTVSLVFLPEGGSLLRIQKVGYRPQTQMVEISPADTAPLTILLTSVTTTLPTVVTTDSARVYISPALRGFEERRKQHFGHFITEAELRKNDNRRMTALVRQFPNVRIICPRTGRRLGECFAATNRQLSRHAILGGSPCVIDLYIDGVRSTDDDLEKLNVNLFAGVEFYSGAATIPPQFNGTGSACGVIALWTRER